MRVYCEACKCYTDQLVCAMAYWGNEELKIPDECLVKNKKKNKDERTQDSQRNPEGS